MSLPGYARRGRAQRNRVRARREDAAPQACRDTRGGRRSVHVLHEVQLHHGAECRG
jgi:hypothetical protein